MNPWIPHLLRAGGGGGAVLPPTGRTMLANLTSSLILDEGTGDPTWSRATKAWGFNELGYLEELASGCAFFGGARLVQNLCVTKSEDFTNAVWTKTALSAPSANLLVCANSTAAQNVLNGSTPWGATAVGDILYFRYRVQYVDIRYVAITAHSASFGTGIFCNFDLVEKTVSATGCTGTITEVSAGVFDIAIRATATRSDVGATATLDLVNSLTSTRKEAFVGDGIKSIGALRYSANYVTNYDASYVPEYVSVGVLSAPFHGAGIDGAKYLETDWQGAPIATANLLKVRREASAINNLLYSRDLSNAAWSTKTNITAAKTATGLDGIANTATTLTATAADAIILQPITLASGARCASAYVKRRTGTGTISFTQDGGSTWTDITSQINSSKWSRVQITATLADPSVGFKIGTSGDAIDVDCVQNEAGSVATSPIVTTTAIITRNADLLTYQAASNIDAALGTLFCEYSVYEQTSAAPRAIIGLSTTAATANALLLHATSVATSSLSSGDGTTIFAKTGLGSAVNTKRKAAVSWGTGRSLTAEGLATQSGVFSGTLPSVAIAPGAYTNGTFPLNGYIGPVAIYNYQMTDAELQAITA